MAIIQKTLKSTDTGFLLIVEAISDLILDRKLTTFRHRFLFKRASYKDIPDEICT